MFKKLDSKVEKAIKQKETEIDWESEGFSEYATHSAMDEIEEMWADDNVVKGGQGSGRKKRGSSEYEPQHFKPGKRDPKKFVDSERAYAATSKLADEAKKMGNKEMHEKYSNLAAQHKKDMNAKSLLEEIDLEKGGQGSGKRGHKTYNEAGRNKVEAHGKEVMDKIKNLLEEHGKLISEHGDDFHSPGHTSRLKEQLRGMSIPRTHNVARMKDGKIVTEKKTYKSFKKGDGQEGYDLPVEKAEVEAPKEPKLNDDELIEFLNIRIRSSVRWMLHDHIKGNYKNMEEQKIVASSTEGEPEAVDASNMPMGSPNGPDFEKLAKTEYEQLVRQYAYDKNLLEACRLVKIDIPYVKAQIKEEWKSVQAEYKKSQELADDIDFLIKGGPGSGPKKGFIRKPKGAEKRGGTARTRAMANMSKIKGHEIVYKPYGHTGKREDEGYYHVPKEQAKEKSVEENIDSLIKGGAGSGRHKGSARQLRQKLFEIEPHDEKNKVTFRGKKMSAREARQKLFEEKDQDKKQHEVKIHKGGPGSGRKYVGPSTNEQQRKDKKREAARKRNKELKEINRQSGRKKLTNQVSTYKPNKHTEAKRNKELKEKYKPGKKSLDEVYDLIKAGKACKSCNEPCKDASKGCSKCGKPMANQDSTIVHGRKSFDDIYDMIKGGQGSGRKKGPMSSLADEMAGHSERKKLRQDMASRVKSPPLSQMKEKIKRQKEKENKTKETK